MQMLKVAVSLAAPTVLAVPVAVFGGSSLTLGRRKLMPSLEQVHFQCATGDSNNRGDLFASFAGPPDSSFEFLVSLIFLDDFSQALSSDLSRANFGGFGFMLHMLAAMRRVVIYR